MGEDELELTTPSPPKRLSLKAQEKDQSRTPLVTR